MGLHSPIQFSDTDNSPWLSKEFQHDILVQRPAEVGPDNQYCPNASGVPKVGPPPIWSLWLCLKLPYTSQICWENEDLFTKNLATASFK